ncbi:hypothetical protein OG921_25635 [Aldersonia sp. NBC_00410]|uniref:rhomboid-like protein n=1 Tax=Aldersonia sp. NBC_00410 TaxID=2975954 RepID=UPI00225B489E|nr:rhomboid-like protein [Aldersonia sp. NBC_00410]MCX5046558.1 hypothetical protein [Aldersonia sp. NBC_00410]
MSVRGTASRTWPAVRTYVRRAPWTFAWLAILLVTTVVQHLLTPAALDSLLGDRSTNLNNLADEPLQVLFTSLLWIDGAYWLPYLLSFCVFHATAERWLGAWRWVLVGFTAHVLATYISEGVLGLEIHWGEADASLVDVRDVGVSYFLAGVIGVLTYHVARPWRWGYLGAVLLVYGAPLVLDPDFTELGHFSSILIGLAFYPMVRGRGEPLDPVRVYRDLRGARRRDGVGEIQPISAADRLPPPPSGPTRSATPRTPPAAP